MSKVLKPEFLQRIASDPVLIALIAKEVRKSTFTVGRYIQSNHHNLTLPGVLDVIREHEGLSKDVELLEEVNEGANANS